MDRADAGRIGGTVTLERYGRDQLAEWGKKGGRPRSMTCDDIRRQHSNKNNHNKEVKGSSGTYREMKKEYAARHGSNGDNGIQEAVAPATTRGQLPERKST